MEQHGSLFENIVLPWAERDPDRIAIDVAGESLTFAQLAALVRTTASWLVDHGTEVGDRVIVRFPNSAENIVCALAVGFAGGIAVLLPPSASADRVNYVVEWMKPRLALHDGSLAGLASTPAHTIRIDRATMSIDLPHASAARGTLPHIAGHEDAIVIFSSGSTGRPKGVVLKHRAILANARNLATVFDLREDHRELVLAPMQHSGAFQRTLATLRVGGRVFTFKTPIPVPAVLDTIEKLEIHGVFVPPPLLRLVLRNPADAIARATRSLRGLETGTAPVTESELRSLPDVFPHTRLFYFYGMTECSRATVLDVRAHAHKLTTVGPPTPGVNVKICDADGNALPVGEVGQILLQAPQQTEGYYGLPELNRERFPGGWVATGDYGVLDAEGFLSYRGRRDDMITSAGFHFFPAEVETELGAVPGVHEYIVAGVRDASGILEQVPWAFVVPVNPEGFTTDEFVALARKRLPSHMVPRRVIVVSALPLTPSGKPDRMTAVKRYAEAS